MKHLLILLKFTNLADRSKVAETDQEQKQFSNTLLPPPKKKVNGDFLPICHTPRSLLY